MRHMETVVVAITKEKLVLEIAAEKTEAIWMHVVLRIDKPSLSWLFVQGERIGVKADLKKHPGWILQFR